MNREKRTVPKTIHFMPSIAAAVEAAAAHDNRSISSLVHLALQRDPTIQLFIQRIERKVANG